MVSAMWWTSTMITRRPADELGVQDVSGAVLTTFAHGAIPVVRRTPNMFVSGAVYQADGRLVRASQRTGGYLGDHALSVDLPTLPESTGPVQEVAGTWLYGGTWFCHFGHFLTETLTTLWPQVPYERVIAHPFWFGRHKLPYQLEALRLLGIDEPPAVMGGQRVRVERLLVPTRTLVPNAYAREEAVGVWDRMRQRVEQERGAPRSDAPELIFLSRSRLDAALPKNAGVRRASRPLANGRAVDELATELGFQVVYPETMTLSEQIDLIRSARVLAGPGGSALHLSVFTDPSAVVVELADGRGRDRPVLTQEILCEVRGQRMGWVPLQRAAEGWDLAQLRSSLTAYLDAV